MPAHTAPWLSPYSAPTRTGGDSMRLRALHGWPLFQVTTPVSVPIHSVRSGPKYSERTMLSFSFGVSGVSTR